MLVSARLLSAAFVLYVAALLAYQSAAWWLGGSADWRYAGWRAIWGFWAYLVLYVLACVDPDAQLTERDAAKCKEPT